MSFMYIVGTVTAGYPLITGVATAAGMKSDWAFYISKWIFQSSGRKCFGDDFKLNVILF